MKEIHIAIALDRPYIRPFYVMATSLLMNTKKAPIVIHAICPELTGFETDLIMSHVNQLGGQIKFYSIDREVINRFSVPSNSPFSLAIFYRLFFPSIIPSSIRKILYLDSDIIVNRDIWELFNVSLDGYPVGAITDSMMPLRDDLGLRSREDYFNSGVLLIDIDVWKDQRISEMAIQYILENNEKMIFVDQDALNKVLDNNWLHLEGRYNLMPLRLAPMESNSENIFLDNQVILHFAGQPKPWGIRAVRFKTTYDNYDQHFLKTAIGQKIVNADLEHAFVNLIGLEPFCEAWTLEQLIELGFGLHLIWIIEVRNYLGNQSLTLLFEGYYSKYDKSEKSLHLLTDTFDTHQNKIEFLFNSIANSTNFPMLPPWTRPWSELCKAECVKLRKDGLLEDPLTPLVFISEFINDQLMIVQPAKSVLFFILEKTFSLFDQNKNHENAINVSIDGNKL